MDSTRGLSSGLAAVAAAAAKPLQSCPTLCDPLDGSPPGGGLQKSVQEGPCPGKKVA